MLTTFTIKGVIIKYNKTNEEFISIVKESNSIAEVIIKCGLIPAGGNYQSVGKRIKSLSLDISHFKSHAWNKGQFFGPKRPIEDYLSNKFPIQSHALRKRLIKEKIKENKCESCNLSEWLGLPIKLELHHIDGDHSNNNLNNLKVLCPNCHALTSTFRGKNIKGAIPREKTNKKSYNIESKSHLRKCIRPDYQKLMKEIQETSYLAVAKKYGVCDNTVRKWKNHYEKYKTND